MQLSTIQAVLSTDKDTRTDYFDRLINSKRNAIIDIHHEYYDGNHWSFDSDNKSQVTMSGATMFSKQSASGVKSSKDPYQRTATRSGSAYHSGQLQVTNYPKLFIQKYQEYITGAENDDILVKLGEEFDEATQESINVLWGDLNTFIKEQTSRMVLDTVFLSKLSYNVQKKDYEIDIVDAVESFPIYDRKTIVGMVQAYTVTKEDLKLMGIDVSTLDKKNGKYSFAMVTYPDDNGNYMRIWVVNGKKYITNPKGGYEATMDNGEYLVDELNFNAYSVTPNINHAFHNFDDTHLEDSEMFDWIRKNDAINASDTIEFIANQYFAMPQVKIDKVEMKSRGYNMDDPALKQEIAHYSYMPGGVTGLPIEVVSGHSIPDSYYKGKESLQSDIHKLASIPQWLMDSNGFSNVTAETLQIGFQMLERKIKQKREQLSIQIRELTYKYLQIHGKTREGLLLKDFDCAVEWNEIFPLSNEKQIEFFQNSAVNGLIPTEYAITEMLKLVGRADDVEDVIFSRNQLGLDKATALRAEIDKKRAIEKQAKKAEEQVQVTAKRKAEIASLNEQIKQAKK